MAKVVICADSKAYRGLYLKTTGFCNDMGSDYDPFINDAQKDVVHKIGRGDFQIVIDDNGNAELLIE